MIKNGCAFVYLRDRNAAHRSDVFTVFSDKEVLRNIRIVDFELLELLVSQRLIIATLPQCGKQVSLRDFLFVDLLFDLYRFSSLFLRHCLLLAIIDHGAMLLKQVHNLVLVVFFGELGGCLSSLILVGNVDSLFEQILNHLVAALLDSVVDGSLAICIYSVKIRASANQLLGCLDVAFADAVEDGGLSVGVQVVDVGAVLDQQINYFVVAFPHSIIKRQLVQLVLRLWVDTLIDEEGDETQGSILILYSTCLEQGRLLKIYNFVLDARNVYAALVHHLDDFIRIAALKLLEKLSHKLDRNLLLGLWL